MLQLGPGSDLMAGWDQSAGCDQDVPSDLLFLAFLVHLTFLYVKQGMVLLTLYNIDFYVVMQQEAEGTDRQERDPWRQSSSSIFPK